MNFQDIMKFNYPYNEKIFNRLVIQLKKNNVVPFIGAGMSVLFDHTYPLWDGFLTDTYKEYLSYDHDFDDFKALDHEDKAQYLYDEVGKMEFNLHLQEVFGEEHLQGLDRDDFSNKPVQLLPVIFHSNLIVTTNYDKVIEKIYQLFNDNPITVTHPGHFEELNNSARENKLLLFKIHGDITAPDSIILTKQQYEKAYQNEVLLRSLKRIFTNKVLLFLGCSLEKDRCLNMLNQVLESGMINYCITSSAYEKMKDKRDRLAEDYHVQSIFYPENQHDCLYVILKEIMDQFLSTADVPSVSVKELFQKYYDKIYSKKGDQITVNYMNYLHTIDQQLFPDVNNNINDLSVGTADGNAPLYHIVKQQMEQNDQHVNILLLGEGRMGKTTALIDLMSRLIHQYYVFFVPLQKINENNRIIHMIRNEVFFGASNDVITSTLANNKIFYLLDGYNEVNEDNLWIVDDEIELLRNQHMNMVISSRSELRNCSGFMKCEVQPLDNEVVTKYLEQRKVCVPMEESELYDLLKEPLMLVLYTVKEKLYSQLRYQDIDINRWNHEFWKTRRTAGAIIWNFLQTEHFKLMNSKVEQAKNSILAINVIAPYLAWRLVQCDRMQMEAKDLTDWIKEGFSYLKEVTNNPHGILDIMDDVRNGIQDENKIISNVRMILTNQHILHKNGQAYVFQHQMFRDCLTAVHCLNSIDFEKSSSNPEAWGNKALPYSVLKFIVELDENNAIDELWKRTGNCEPMPKESHTMYNLVQIQLINHNNNLSVVSFDGQDLSENSLNGICLAEGDHHASFRNTRIAQYTFIPPMHCDKITCVVTTRRYIISGSNDSTIIKRDLFTGQVIGKAWRGHREAITCIAITPDEKYAISGSMDGTLIKWEIATGKQVGEPWIGDKRDIKCVCMVENSNYLISASDDTLTKWDITTGKYVGEPWKGHKSIITCITSTKDGKYVFSGSRDYTIIKWDISGKQVGLPWEEHKSEIICITIDENGKMISLSQDGEMIMRDTGIENLKVLFKKSVTRKNFFHTYKMFVIKNKYIFFASSKCIIREEIINNESIGSVWYENEYVITGMALTDDEKYLIIGDQNDTITKIDVETGNIVGGPWTGNSQVLCAAITQNSQFLISGYQDSVIVKWSVQTGKMVNKPWLGHRGGVTCVAITEDDRYAISGSDDRTLIKWDIQSEKAIGEPWIEHKYSITSLAVSGNYAISSGVIDELIEWNIISGQPIRKIHHLNNGYTTSLALTKDQKYVFIGSCDGHKSLLKWNINKGKLFQSSIQESHMSIRCMDLTKDNRYLIFGAFLYLYLFDISRNKLIGRSRMKNKGLVRCIASTVDGKYVISGSENRTLTKWDMSTGEAIGSPWKSHMYTVSCIAVTGDNKYVISGSYDSTLIMWDIETGTPIKKFQRIPNCFIAGCDFTGAEFENEDIKQLIYSNGGIISY